MATFQQNGLAPVVHEVADRVRALARLEGELVAIELRDKAAALGSAAAVFATAALLLVLALGFGLAAVAAALATMVPVWLALLLVAAALVLTAVVALLVGRSLARRATPPLPEQALAEAKATGEALKGQRHG
jgi:hypothetical protein